MKKAEFLEAKLIDDQIKSLRNMRTKLEYAEQVVVSHYMLSLEHDDPIVAAYYKRDRKGRSVESKVSPIHDFFEEARQKSMAFLDEKINEAQGELDKLLNDE